MTTIPTTTDIYNSVLADLEAQNGISIPLFGKNFIRALAIVQTAKLKLMYLRIGKLQKNIFVDTADPESLGGTLERWARVKLRRNRFKATAGKYQLTVTGSIGSVVPESTTFKSDDNSSNPGILYVLDADHVMTGSPDTITVRALTTGLEGKLVLLDTLTATAPISGVDSGAYVSAEVVIPLAAETMEAYRAAALLSWRLEAQGGAVTDFRIWSQDAQGVKAVYPYAKPAASAEMFLYVEATPADSIDGFGTPSAQLLLDVEAVVEFNPDTTLSLNERGRRPIGVFNIDFLPVTIIDVDIIVTGFNGLTPTKQALLLTAITNMVNAIRPFVPAADILADKNDFIDSNKVIGTITSTISGAQFTSVTIKINGVAMTSYTFAMGNIPNLVTVTYN